MWVVVVYRCLVNISTSLLHHDELMIDEMILPPKVILNNLLKNPLAHLIMTE